MSILLTLWLSTAIPSGDIRAALPPLQEHEGGAADMKKKDEEEAKKRIKQFQDDVKKAKGDEAALLAAVNALSEMRHPLILKELARCLAGGSVDFRKGVLARIVEYEKDRTAADILMAAFKSAQDKEWKVALVEALGKLGCRAAASFLHGLFNDKETELVYTAIHACGTLGSKESIPALITLLKSLEGIQDPGAHGGGPPESDPTRDLPGGGDIGNEQVKRRDRLVPGVLDALASITGERNRTAKEYDAWWAKNKATFKEKE